MRRFAVLALALALIGSLAPLGHSDTGKLMLARVPVDSTATAQYVLNHFDDSHNNKDGYVELVLWPGDAERLQRAGIAYEIIERDLVARDRSMSPSDSTSVDLPGPDLTDYRRLPDFEAEMRALADENPKLVRLLELPEPTLEGRTVYGVEVSHNVKSDDGRATFYVDGVHHAREWPAAEYPMMFAYQLVENFGKSARYTKLLKNVRVVIVPIVNPDGYDYSRESRLQNSNLGAGNGFEGYWRKNRRSLTGLTVPVAQKNPDAFGVDPNRNYALLWGEDEQGSSSTQIDQTYRGEAPFSEPETRNVQGQLLSRNVTGVITNHTHGRLVLRPWGHTYADPPDENILAPLGQKMATAMGGYTNQKGLSLYATHGTTDDWAYAAIGALGYTFEHGSSFHPPYVGTVTIDAPGVMEAFTLGAEAAAKDAWHSVLKGKVVASNGASVNAKLQITKKIKTPLGGGNPTGEDFFTEKIRLDLKTEADGAFEWHLNPSTRPIPELTKRESYELTITAGGAKKTMTIVLKRGQVLDLGTIRL